MIDDLRHPLDRAAALKGDPGAALRTARTNDSTSSRSLP